MTLVLVENCFTSTKNSYLARMYLLNKMKKPNDTDVNKLKDQVKQLQDEIYPLQMQKDILGKAGEIIKKPGHLFGRTHESRKNYSD